MKQTMKLFLAAFVMMATVSLVGCGEKDNEPSNQQNYEASNTFEIIYNGQALAAGATVDYTLSSEELANDDAEVGFFVKNKSDNSVQRVFKVEFVEGPISMAEHAPICYGVCEDLPCPYTSGAVTLAAGATDNQAIIIHLYPTMNGDAHTGTYKITVGKGASLEDPQVCFLKFNW